MAEASQPSGMTLEAIVDTWGLSDATAHDFKTWATSIGAALDKPLGPYWASITERHLESAGFQFLDRLQILARLKPQSGDASMAAYAHLEAQMRTLSEAQQTEKYARQLLQSELQALKGRLSRSSGTSRSQEGAALMAKATLQHNLTNQLEPLDEPLLLHILDHTAAAFEKARAVPVNKLGEDNVQELYVSILSALKAARPHDSLQPHDTHATGLKGMPRCRPDIVVTDCESALPPHVVDYYELKAQLSKGSAQNEAAYQLDERRQQLEPHQPSRRMFWGYSGGLDSVQLWQLERDGMAARRSDILPLYHGRESAGLQALVRIWCTPAMKKGYKAPHLPPPIVLPDERRLEGLNYMTTTSTTVQGTARADVTSVVVGKLEPGGTMAVAKTTSSEQRLKREEEALRALHGLDGVVELVGVGWIPTDRSQWLVMQPVGVHIELGAPAAVKIGALKQVAAIIDSLAGRNFIHGDISHFNVLRKDRDLSDIARGAAKPEVYFIDFGTARRIKQDLEAGGDYKPDHTGTPMFMALSTLKGQRQGVSSELESAMYVFLYWATEDNLHWRRSRGDLDYRSSDSVDRKWSAMTFHFEEKVAEKIDDDDLRMTARRLRALFFPENIYNQSVTASQFVQAISSAV
ncbi:hypothetical protein COCOBI_11-0440 [Coccomyxa sp. Obi]|nr:hypothetical protein COCOBI_11-0440 [Coccomyxa sp. Obi]